MTEFPTKLPAAEPHSQYVMDANETGHVDMPSRTMIIDRFEVRGVRLVSQSAADGGHTTEPTLAVAFYSKGERSWVIPTMGLDAWRQLVANVGAQIAEYEQRNSIPTSE